MFVRVQLASCSDRLEQLERMVENILKYAAGRDEKKSLEGLKRKLEEQDGETAVLMKYKAVWRAAEEVLRLSLPECRKLLWMYRNNLKFPEHKDDEIYRLYAQSPDSREFKAISRLCRAIYDTVDAGKWKKMRAGGDKNTKVPENNKVFDMKMLKEMYAQENGENGLICPVCLKEILFEEKEGENDHYFPKSQYPTLMLHPYNLLPVCAECNGPSFKHEKLPADKEDIGKKGELKTVFLPYIRMARDEIEFSVSDTCRREIIMKKGAGGDCGTEKRIQNIERLYGVKKRWDANFGYVYEDLRQELREEGKRRKTKKARVKQLRKILKANADSTKGRREFVKGIYCAFLLQKSDEELEELFLR